MVKRALNQNHHRARSSQPGRPPQPPASSSAAAQVVVTAALLDIESRASSLPLCLLLLRLLLRSTRSDVFSGSSCSDSGGDDKEDEGDEIDGVGSAALFRSPLVRLHSIKSLCVKSRGSSDGRVKSRSRRREAVAVEAAAAAAAEVEAAEKGPGKHLSEASSSSTSATTLPGAVHSSDGAHRRIAVRRCSSEIARDMTFDDDSNLDERVVKFWSSFISADGDSRRMRCWR